MVDELLSHQLPMGMKKEGALNLLGAPDMSGAAAGSSVLKYRLGMWSGFRVDYDSLDLEFDESGRLVRASRMQH